MNSFAQSKETSLLSPGDDTECTRRHPSRREFFGQFGYGLGSIALADLLSGDLGLATSVSAEDSSPLPAWRVPQKATRIVYFFMSGGPSQLDTFDPKPELSKFEGKTYSGDVKQIGTLGRRVGRLTPSPLKFEKRGKSGLEISELFPQLAIHADDLCVIRSMFTDSSAHGSACLEMNTGSSRIGNPSIGSWTNLGLGSLNENLPPFVVMLDPRGGPSSGASNWGSGFLSPEHQGLIFREQMPPLRDLANPPGVTDESQKRVIDLIKDLNQEHGVAVGVNHEIVARIKSYELAYRLQHSAVESVGIDQEPEAIKSRYGIGKSPTNIFGRQCLLARRLLERGVRYIQIYSGAAGLEDSWDGHTDCAANHRARASETDLPIAAFLQDLKDRGLWKDTVVVWGGEFGRTPTFDPLGKGGRDHNRHGFSVWLAGGCIKGGQAIGKTDEIGLVSVEERHHVGDLHATLLDAIGLDAYKLFRQDPRRPSPGSERRSQIISGVFKR
ncbi:DUF1501 domain-containing protein [bacterium]|nr:DUF1501 domain-containing protein [bacterium]